MRTKRELVTAALRDIGIVAIFEDPSGDDYSHVAGAYDDLHAELTDKGLAYWANTDADTEEIPSSVFSALTGLLVGEVCGSYGREEPTKLAEDGRPVTVSLAGMRRLREHNAKKPSGEATEFSVY